MNDLLLSIIIPAYNEEPTLEDLITRIIGVDMPLKYELLVVDDASIDRTPEKVLGLKRSNPGTDIRFFKNRINRGKGFSVYKGIKRARGNIILIQDADDEYDPSEIPPLLLPILEDNEKVVYGSRFLNNPFPARMAIPNLIGNRVLTSLANMLYSLNITDLMTCYKAFRRELLDGVALHASRFAFEPEITSIFAKKGIKIHELPISYKGRGKKEGKKIKTRDFFYSLAMLLRKRFFD